MHGREQGAGDAHDKCGDGCPNVPWISEILWIHRRWIAWSRSRGCRGIGAQKRSTIERRRPCQRMSSAIGLWGIPNPTGLGSRDEAPSRSAHGRHDALRLALMMSL